MVFSSMVFIFVFLPTLLLVYFINKNENRNIILLLFSLFFYAWGEPKLIIVMILSIIMNYIFGRTMIIYNRKIILLLTIIFNIGMLFYFKYTNFLIENLVNVFHMKIKTISVVMPIGISFFTFQIMSYVIDVYKNEVEPQKDIFKLALYITLFPQLIAGPIVKYHDVCIEIEHRYHTVDKIMYGIYRFVMGLSKKVILANTFGRVVDSIFSLNMKYLTPAIALFGSISYMLQLYFDFSGYSDMAIGLGKIFGFTFLENFNYPYVSASITEFWRRWHISLSSWFREYLYIPLGGNRKGKIRTYINLLIVFFVTGLWHGASWNFVFWGVWHGLFLIIERVTGVGKIKGNRLLNIFRHAYTLTIVLIGWIIFRAPNIPFLIVFIKRILGINTDYLKIYGVGYYCNNFFILILIIAIVISTPCMKKFADPMNKESTIIEAFSYIFIILLFIICISFLASSTYNPFIYFRF